MKDIVITLPAKIKWLDYEHELQQAAEGNLLNFKVPSFPKEAPIGQRCYVVHQGIVRGWLTIVGYQEHDFTCTTTGTNWKGKFIQRSGVFQCMKEVIPMKGFQGYHYAPDDWRNK